MRSTMAILAALAVTGCMAEAERDSDSPAAAPAVADVMEPDRTAPASPTRLVPDGEVGGDAVAIRSEGGNPRFDDSCVITQDSVAGIAMPDTLGEFVSAFPAGTTLSFYPAYMVDFGKLCLRADGADALCADFESYDVEQYRPGIEVVGLSVYARQCRTPEGIGPRSPVAEAARAYGAPTFAFTYDNEGREYLSFADGPEGIAFRAESEGAAADTTSPGVPNGPYGGDYGDVEGDGSYFETEAYYPDAEIREVYVSGPFEPVE